MKGKNTFTTSEVQKIKKLIEEKVIAAQDKQKSVRAKIRRIGFYYSDFSLQKDGYTVTDFENLISSKQIVISNGLNSSRNNEQNNFNSRRDGQSGRQDS